MRYYWLTDRVRQKQFDVYWRPGRDNLDDYHTKHHSAQHHKDMHGLILHQANRNFPHSHNPTCVRAQTHIHMRVLREPHSSHECWRVHTMSQYITLTQSELGLSHTFSNGMINITHLNEVH
jgi:hypothetical protein